MSDNDTEIAKHLEHSSSEIVPLKEKLSYSFAQMPATFYGGIMGVIQSFYFAWMGLLNIWIFIAQIIYAIWNVINDPIFGKEIHDIIIKKEEKFKDISLILNLVLRFLVYVSHWYFFRQFHGEDRLQILRFKFGSSYGIL
jgi:Na+/melibiose symporter-like transporter